MENTTPSKKVVQLRKASMKDSIKIFRAIKDTFEATQMSYPPVDDDSAITWIMDVIRNHGLVYIAEVSGRIVGSVGFQPSEFPWANPKHPHRWYLSNVWFYVHPGYRKYGTAEALIQKSMIFAKEAGILLSVGIYLEENAELKERFLKMKGLTYVGGSFLYQNHLKSLTSPEAQGDTNGRPKSIQETGS